MHTKQLLTNGIIYKTCSSKNVKLLEYFLTLFIYYIIQFQHNIFQSFKLSKAWLLKLLTNK